MKLFHSLKYANRATNVYQNLVAVQNAKQLDQKKFALILHDALSGKKILRQKISVLT